MKKFNINELANELKINVNVLKNTFNEFNEMCKVKKDHKFGRKFFRNPPQLTDVYHVAIIEPIVHYTMGGIKVNPESEIINTNGNTINGV